MKAGSIASASMSRPAIMARSNVDLVFDGLDAASQVYLNGTQVLTADNMFRMWRLPAKLRLHAGKNELRVVFPSPIKAAADLAALDPWQPKTKTAPKTYTRKAAYEYGWDWGPTFVTSGIWRPVRLEAWDKVRIADFAIRQRDVSKEVAHLDGEFQIEAAHDGPARISVQFGNDGKPVTIVETLNLHAGSNTVTVPLEVREPRLWYPAGYGDQTLYQFVAQVTSGSQPNRPSAMNARSRPAFVPSFCAGSPTSGAAPLNL